MRTFLPTFQIKVRLFQVKRTSLSTKGRTIHFDEELIQSVLLLAVSSEASSASLPSDCIDFIDEKDARSVLPSQSKHITNLSDDKRSSSVTIGIIRNIHQVLHTIDLSSKVKAEQREARKRRPDSLVMVQRRQTSQETPTQRR